MGQYHVSWTRAWPHLVERESQESEYRGVLTPHLPPPPQPGRREALLQRQHDIAGKQSVTVGHGCKLLQQGRVAAGEEGKRGEG